MATRMIQACDAAAALIRAAWGPSDPDGVDRLYAPPLNISEEVEPQHRGRRVYVFPGPETVSQIARDTQWRSYIVSVLVVEKFVDGAGPPPEAWIDERMAFTQDKVLNLLADNSLKLIGEMTPDPDQTAEWGRPFDPEQLLENRTFWSVVRFNFVEPATLAGAPPS